MWPFKKTNYPKQVIPPKVLEVINKLDLKLSTQPQDECDNFTLIGVSISLMNQFKPVNQLLKAFNFEYSKYIPRSIAYYTEADGTWVFVIGVYTDTLTASSPLQNSMWVELLTRTNSARSA